MIRAAVPVAAINEDGYFGRPENHIGGAAKI